MTLEDYVRILRRYWIGVSAFVVLGLLAAAAANAVIPKVYTADASGFVTADSDGNASMALVIDSYAKSRALSYVELARNRAVADRVIEELGLDTTSTELVDRISVSVPTDTVTLRVSASAATPQEAQDLANAWIVALSEQIEELESGSTESTDSDTGEVISGSAAVYLVPQETAVLPSSPSSPNMRMNVALGLLVGLALGVGYAITRNILDKRIRSAEQVEREFSIPVIGTLPADDQLTRSGARLVPYTSSTTQNAHFPLAEALRELRTNIQFINVDNPPKIVVMTSPVPNDGKSMVAANLALTIAETGARVVLVDADLRKPSVAGTFGITTSAGLTDVIVGRANIADVLQRSALNEQLYVLPAGMIPPNPSELLASRVLSDLLQELAEHAVVILDAPPLLAVTDGAILAARYDGAILVITAGKTTLEELSKALDNIQKVSGTPLGVIINRVPTKGADKGQYGYYGGRYTYAGETDAPDLAEGEQRADADARRSRRHAR